MSQFEEVFKKHLRINGLKLTPERKKILEAVFALHTHFDVEELFEYLKKKSGKNISRATIYRTIPCLVKSSLVHEVSRNEGKIRYEHVFGHEHHDHLICISCGSIMEFKSDTIEKIQNDICKKYGFKAIDHNLGIKGYCKKCNS